MAATKKPPVPAEPPALDALPANAVDNELTHRIINAAVGGTGKRELAKKFELPEAYISAVVRHYLQR